MAFALEQLRPRLSPTAIVHVRSDGTAGLHDPATGNSAEVGADQVALLGLIDGDRTLKAIAESHYQQHHFVPFTALRDLLRTLAVRELLANPPAEREAFRQGERPNWMQRDARVLVSFPVPGAGPLSVVLALGSVAAALWLARRLPVALSPWDVLWALAGVSLALSLREVFRATAATLGGHPPQRWLLQVRLGIPFLSPDGDGIVLLDRRKRVFAHQLALLGAAVGLSTFPVSRGLVFGALVVLAADLCPFAPTSAGKLLAALSGRVDLREHARAYLSRRFLRRVTQTSTFEGEGSLIVSALISLAWLGLGARFLFTRGAVWVLQLLALAVDARGVERPLAFAGASLLVLLIALSVVGLLIALWRAAQALLPQAVKAQAGDVQPAQAVALEVVPLFSRLPAEEQQALAKAAEVRSYAPGNAIVVQGAPGDCFFVIREGLVAVEVEAASGLKREVTRLGPGDGFGETALLDQEPRTATVRALTPVSVLALPRDAFDRARQGLAAEQVTGVLRATAALKRNPLFGRLPADRLSALALRLIPRKVEAGTAVIQAGEAGQEFFLVNEGEVEVLGEAGEHLADLKAGDHFGEVALLRDVPRTATVKAKTDSVVLALDKATFLDAMAADLGLSAQLEAGAAVRAGGA